ncbi:MAG: hypothetical protein GY756_01785 [bacterium]|nr:hypothetical protein [bacterium]
MKKLNSRKLRNAYQAVVSYQGENSEMIFNIPSLMKYCIENDVRSVLKEQKLDDSHIDNIFQNINLNVKLKVNRHNNTIKFDLKYKDFDSFITNYK